LGSITDRLFLRSLEGNNLESIRTMAIALAMTGDGQKAVTAFSLLVLFRTAIWRFIFCEAR
jgi:hypothetical protein